MALPALGHWGTCPHPSTSNNFIFNSLWSKSDSQLSKYCVVCEISWCRCQQLAALSISTALVTKLLVIAHARDEWKRKRDGPSEKVSFQLVLENLHTPLHLRDSALSLCFLRVSPVAEDAQYVLRPETAAFRASYT